LYLTPIHKPLNPEEQERERIQLELNLDSASSFNEIDRISKNSKLKNFLSKDLMRKIDNFSPAKSFLSNVSSKVLHLQLTELDNEKKQDDFSDLISPINIRDNKHFRLNTHDLKNDGVERSIIQLISPANNEKQAFDFGKNNFLPRKNSTKISDKNEIKINYYANNINISNNNHFYNTNTEQQQKTSNNEINFNDFKPNYSQQNNMYGNMNSYGMNMGTMNNMNNFQGNQYQQFYPPQQFQNNYPQYQQNTNYRDPHPSTVPLNSISKIMEKTGEKKKRQFAERQGDWVCMKCKNLNFSFRVVCNRCQLPKNESELLYLEHMNSLKSLNLQNDFLQNQIFSQGTVGNSFNSNMFSPNMVCNSNTIYGGGKKTNGI